MEAHTFNHAYITPSYIRTYIVLKNISFYIYIIVCVYRGYLYISNIEYIEFGYFRELYFNLHLFKILRYLAYLFGCDCFDSSLFVFTMNTLPPSAQPILGPFLLRFWEPLGGPLAVMTSTFEELLDASWCSFRVKILEVRRFRGWRKLPPASPHGKETTCWNLNMMSSKFRNCPLSRGPSCSNSCRRCLRMYCLMFVHLCPIFYFSAWWIYHPNWFFELFQWSSYEHPVNQCFWTTIVCIRYGWLL